MFRSKVEDVVAKRKRILEKLVPRLPVPREEQRAPNALPNVRRRNTQTRNGTGMTEEMRSQPFTWQW